MTRRWIGAALCLLAGAGLCAEAHYCAAQSDLLQGTVVGADCHDIIDGGEQCRAVVRVVLPDGEARTIREGFYTSGSPEDGTCWNVRYDAHADELALVGHDFSLYLGIALLSLGVLLVQVFAFGRSWRMSKPSEAERRLSLVGWFVLGSLGAGFYALWGGIISAAVGLFFVLFLALAPLSASSSDSTTTLFFAFAALVLCLCVPEHGMTWSASILCGVLTWVPLHRVARMGPQRDPLFARFAKAEAGEGSDWIVEVEVSEGNITARLDDDGPRALDVSEAPVFSGTYLLSAPQIERRDSLDEEEGYRVAQPVTEVIVAEEALAKPRAGVWDRPRLRRAGAMALTFAWAAFVAFLLNPS